MYSLSIHEYLQIKEEKNNGNIAKHYTVGLNTLANWPNLYQHIKCQGNNIIKMECFASNIIYANFRYICDIFI